MVYDRVLQKDFKRKLKEILQCSGLIDKEFSGEIKINLRKGGIRNLEKVLKVEIIK